MASDDETSHIDLPAMKARLSPLALNFVTGINDKTPRGKPLKNYSKLVQWLATVPNCVWVEPHDDGAEARAQALATSNPAYRDLATNPATDIHLCCHREALLEHLQTELQVNDGLTEANARARAAGNMRSFERKLKDDCSLHVVQRTDRREQVKKWALDLDRVCRAIDLRAEKARIRAEKAEARRRRKRTRRRSPSSTPPAAAAAAAAPSVTPASGGGGGASPQSNPRRTSTTKRARRGSRATSARVSSDTGVAPATPAAPQPASDLEPGASDDPAAQWFISMNGTGGGARRGQDAALTLLDAAASLTDLQMDPEVLAAREAYAAKAVAQEATDNQRQQTGQPFGQASPPLRQRRGRLGQARKAPRPDVPTLATKSIPPFCTMIDPSPHIGSPLASETTRVGGAGGRNRSTALEQRGASHGTAAASAASAAADGLSLRGGFDASGSGIFSSASYEGLRSLESFSHGRIGGDDLKGDDTSNRTSVKDKERMMADLGSVSDIQATPISKDGPMMTFEFTVPADSAVWKPSSPSRSAYETLDD